MFLKDLIKASITAHSLERVPHPISEIKIFTLRLIKLIKQNIQYCSNFEHNTIKTIKKGVRIHYFIILYQDIFNKGHFKWQNLRKTIIKLLIKFKN